MAVIAPWIFSSAVPWLVTKQHSSLTWLFSGLGGLFGLTVLSWSLRIFENFGYSIKLGSQLPFWMALTCVSICIIFGILNRATLFSGLKRARASLICLAVIPVAASAIYLSLMTPLQAWDSFGHWALRAVHMIRALGTEGADFQYVNRHPPTIVHLNAWSLIAQNGGATKYFSYFSLVWTMYVFSAILTLISLCKQLGMMPVGIAVVVLMLITLPLLENHWAIAGYAEVPLGCAVLSSVVALYFYKNDAQNISVFVPIFALLNTLLFKNIGVIFFTIICIASLIFSTWGPKISRYFQNMHSKILLIAPLIALTMLFYIEAFIPDLADTHFKLSAFGRNLRIELITVSRFLEIEIAALLKNLSFSIFFVFQFIALCYSFNESEPIHRAPWFVIVAGAWLLAIHPLSLVFDASARHALAGADTGHSRFFLVSVIGSFATVPIFIAHVTKLHVRPELDP